MKNISFWQQHRGQIWNLQLPDSFLIASSCQERERKYVKSWFVMFEKDVRFFFRLPGKFSFRSRKSRCTWLSAAMNESKHLKRIKINNNSNILATRARSGKLHFRMEEFSMLLYMILCMMSKFSWIFSVFYFRNFYYNKTHFTFTTKSC